MKRELRRAPDEKYLGGVAAGVAYRFGIPTVAVRIAWLLTLLSHPSSGAGAALYILLWIFLPSWATTPEDYEQVAGEKWKVPNLEKYNLFKRYNLPTDSVAFTCLFIIVIGISIINNGYSKLFGMVIVPEDEGLVPGLVAIAVGLFFLIWHFIRTKKLQDKDVQKQ